MTYRRESRQRFPFDTTHAEAGHKFIEALYLHLFFPMQLEGLCAGQTRQQGDVLSTCVPADMTKPSVDASSTPSTIAMAAKPTDA